MVVVVVVVDWSCCANAMVGGSEDVLESEYMQCW